MTEQGEGQQLSAEDRLLKSIFGESYFTPSQDALDYSTGLEAAAGLPGDSLSASAEEGEEELLADALDRSLRRVLTDREATVLRGRFGLIDGGVRTLKEMGQEIGRSTTTAWRDERRAIKKLRAEVPFMKQFGPYVELP